MNNTPKEEAESKRPVSLMEHRKAQYMTPVEEVYNNKKLNDEELMWQSFRDNIEPPTPQLHVLDGYETEEEVSGDEENCGN